MSRKTFYVVGLLAAFFIAGVGSYYASSHPDGLEFVAEQVGFLDTAEDSATVDSPLADYQTSGVENSRLSGGLAGVIGCAVVLLLAGGLFWGVRRRGDHAPVDADEPTPAQPTSEV